MTPTTTISPISYLDFMTKIWEKHLTKILETLMTDNNPLKPNHYKIPGTDIDIGTAIEHLPFWQANAIKYLYRVDGKDSPIENLDKAIECIKREKERRIRRDGNGLRQEGTTDRSWKEQLRENPPLTGHVRSTLWKSPQNIPTRGSGYVGESEGYETYRVDSGYEI